MAATKIGHQRPMESIFQEILAFWSRQRESTNHAPHTPGFLENVPAGTYMCVYEIRCWLLRTRLLYEQVGLFHFGCNRPDLDFSFSLERVKSTRLLALHSA